MRELSVFARRSEGRLANRRAYEIYIHSPAWFAKRQWWFEAISAAMSGPVRCVGCDRVWLLERDDVHHIDYSRLGAEQVQDLWPLCRQCHELIHEVMAGTKSWRKLSRIQANTLALATIRHGHLHAADAQHVDDATGKAVNDLRSWL